MEDNKRCSTCAIYPFCNKCESPTGCCENWRKRKIGANQYENIEKDS